MGTWKAQRGFGLGLGGSPGDVVVVAVIIGILVLIAVPAYNNYKTLARVGGSLAAVATATVAVEKAFADHGPADMSQRAVTGWTAPAATEHLQSVAIRKDGTITLRFADSVGLQDENQIQIVPVSGDKALDLSLAASAGRKFEWQCGGTAGKTTVPEKYRPKDCR